ncbi:DUF4912 domain-containing protein [Nostoc sp. MS1]|uniref:DUF4912 domain-containing protein n=1 Tax=Nostoc sp. MS1 TaxID=2764711 RepID=UPI001CC6ED29|nr:DUF4912 domain-containing protein [Nostoc sp. MS1]
MLLSAPMLAQSAKETPAFKLPQTVENGTTLRIDGSTSLIAVNQSLKQSFEQQFAGTRVDLATNGTESALKGVLDGSIDVAALARGLTPQEKAQGLEQVRLHREKIAIIVGEENPFKGSLTDRQFARIFRGRITNWSEVEAPAGKIRFIDRPDTSDTRQTLSSYPVFKAAKFATGSTATQVSEDSTAEIVKQLGKDGISYARANQVLKLPGVRVLQLHETTPDDPKYPFSQPLVYVYKKSPKPSVAAFLGFALASPGQKAIETARVAEAEAIAKGETQAPLTATNPTSTPGATTSPVAGTEPFLNSSPNANVFPNAGTTNNNAGTTNNLTQPGVVAPPEAPQLDRSLLWWLLLPVGAIGGLFLWFIKRPSATTALESTPEPSEAETQSDAASISEPLVEVQDNTNNTIIQNHNPTVIQSTNTTTIQEPNNPTFIQAANTTTIQESDNNPTFIQTTAQESNKINLGSSQMTIPPELEQSPWDMEAPAAVVNTSYPQMIEVPKTPTHVEQQTADVVTQIQETPPVEENHQQLIAEELPQAPANSDNEETELAPVANEDTEIVDSLPDLPDFHAIFADAVDEDTVEQTVYQELIDENGQLAAILPTFNDIPEDALNSVADAAEIHENGMLDEGEYLTPSSVGTLTSGAVLAGVGAQAWVGSNHIEEVVTSQVSANANVPDTSLPTISPTTELENGEEPSSVVLKPRNSEWAYVSWYVSPHDQQKLHNQGISELALRLYDVTEIDLSYQQPQQVQQYQCEPGTSDRYVQIPAGDRDYIIDLGYVIRGEWANIARSGSVRVFNSPYTDPLLANLPGLDAASSVVFTPRSPKWAYVSWDISPGHQQLLREHGITQLALRLYDATNIDLSYQHPQLVQQYEFDEITCDRYVSIPHSDHDYMTEVGYVTTNGDWVTIARSAIVRIYNNPQGDFWFVADSELIIHGATDPDATVTIAGKPVTLKSDGTFHLRVPFSEDLLDYLITVTNGEQRKTIHKKFTQETSES